MATNLGFGSYQPGQNPYLQQNVGIAQNDIVKNYQTAIAPRQATMNAAGGSFGNSGLQQVQLEDQRWRLAAARSGGDGGGERPEVRLSRIPKL